MSSGRQSKPKEIWAERLMQSFTCRPKFYLVKLQSTKSGQVLPRNTASHQMKPAHCSGLVAHRLRPIFLTFGPMTPKLDDSVDLMEENTGHERCPSNSSLWQIATTLPYWPQGLRRSPFRDSWMHHGVHPPFLHDGFLIGRHIYGLFTLAVSWSRGCRLCSF